MDLEEFVEFDEKKPKTTKNNGNKIKLNFKINKKSNKN